MSNNQVRKMAFCAICIALAMVTSMIKLFHLPFGGAVTLLSMLFAILPGYFYGPAAGFASGIACGLINFVVDPYILTPVQAILDYGLAFGVFGVAGFFANQKYGLEKGYIVAVLGRWFFSFLSGWLFFAEYAPEGWNPIVYSATYNILYIAAEAAITLVVISIPAVKNALAKGKQMALGR